MNPRTKRGEGGGTWEIRVESRNTIQPSIIDIIIATKPEENSIGMAEEKGRNNAINGKGVTMIDRK